MTTFFYYLALTSIFIFATSTTFFFVTASHHNNNQKKQHHHAHKNSAIYDFLFGSGGVGTGGGPNTLNICPGGYCPPLNNNNTANCQTYSFADNECVSVANGNTLVTASCGFAGNCVYGEYFPETTDCSGQGSFNFSAVASPDSDPTNSAPACMSIDAQPDGSQPTWTYFQTTPGSTQYSSALACGLQCSGCLLLSPPQNFGTCFSFNTGSVRVDGQRQCRQSMVKTYADSCDEDVPQSQLPVGSGFPGACRPTKTIGGQDDTSIYSVSVTCNEPLPTTTLPPSLTTSTAAPAPTAAPTVTRIYCQGSPDCKQDCRPFGAPYNSEQCYNDPPNPQTNISTGSYFTYCTNNNMLINKLYNLTFCMDEGVPLYITARKCYPDGKGNGWYYYCAGQ